MRLAWFLPSYILTDHCIYFCMYLWHFDIAFVFFDWPSYILLYVSMNREYERDYMYILKNEQTSNWRNFFVKLFVYLKKQKTILHEYRLWVVFFCVHVLHNQFGNERRYKQKLDIVIIYECVHCFICTKKTFSTRFKWFVKEYRHSLW